MQRQDTEVGSVVKHAKEAQTSRARTREVILLEGGGLCKTGIRHLLTSHPPNNKNAAPSPYEPSPFLVIFMTCFLV